MNVYRRLLEYLKPDMGRFAGASLFMLLVSASAGATAMIIQPLMDDIFIRRDKQMLLAIPAMLVVIYLVRGIARYYASSMMQEIGQKVVLRIRNRLYERVGRASMRFYSERGTGNLISRITNDVQVVQDSVAIVIYDIVREGFSAVALLAVVFYRDWQLASVSLLVIPAAIAFIAGIGKRLRVLSRVNQEQIASLTSILHETFAGARIVQAFGMEKYEAERFKSANDEYFSTLRRAIRLNEAASPLLEFIGALGLAAVVWYGGMRVMEGHTTVGAFFSFMTALFMLFAPVTKLSRANNKIQQAMAAASRIFELMDIRPEIEDRPGAKLLPPVSSAIEFKSVSFAYNTDPVLKNIDLLVPKGTILAIVGMSGVGKSTLVDLIPRFYDVTAGQVTIDGTDIRDVTLESLRAQIGIVSQDTFLFNDTVRSNIAYGSADQANETAIREAAKAAYADGFIDQLPQQYDTIVGERGTKLSGGQRQRISIARAIMKNPKILILDEATSALDTESEQIVQQALANLLAGRTTFVIAHRLSTVVNADKIVVMEGGKIVETGKHAELIALGGLYKRIYELQFQSQTDPQV